ncbi:MAG: hypothetical protein ABSF54_24045 [Bryobacteraceae bacterium]
MRSRTTFKKRQKELARQEKQRDKAARRVQRKLEKGSPGSGDGLSDEGLDLEDDLAEDGDDVLEPVTPSAASDPHSPSEAH